METWQKIVAGVVVAAIIGAVIYVAYKKLVVPE